MVEKGYKIWEKMNYLEILTMKLAIWFLKKGWGANCLDFAEGCQSCEARRVIHFLEKDIDYCRCID